jgi:CMP-N,N'-diacetyllegionaminic acid synthase
MGSTLLMITARGGTKGLPGKNIKPLRGKPLINYSIEAARVVASDEDILVSTDSEEIKSVAEQIGLRVPFIRPDALATDNAGHHEVLEHGVREMEKLGCVYETLVLLQPTSPFRTGQHIIEALKLFDEGCDMVVSVKQPEDSPFYNQFMEDETGFLVPCLKRAGNRRQDCPAIYTYNGSIYIMRIADIKRTHMHGLKRIRRHLMDDISSLQIDTRVDWLVAEAIIDLGLVPV